MTIAYGIAFGLAIVLLLVYLFVVKKKPLWLTLLFFCVSIVNLGYFLLSMAKTLRFAIFANDVAYFGNAFLCMCMLLTIVDLCGFKIKKWHVIICVSLGILMFAMVATSGFLPWYYKEVSLEIVNGSAKLKKVYGVLHPVYTVYLALYFVSMVVTIVHSLRRRKEGSQKFAALLAGVVCGNLLVWAFEKFIIPNFELLSLTYILSEIILCLLYWMMQDYIHVNDLPKYTATERTRMGIDVATMPMETKIGKVLYYVKDGEQLATREREILECILANKKRKDIASELHLSENTVKTYTRTLYLKLGVTCREELYALLLKD